MARQKLGASEAIQERLTKLGSAWNREEASPASGGKPHLLELFWRPVRGSPGIHPNLQDTCGMRRPGSLTRGKY